MPRNNKTRVCTSKEKDCISSTELNLLEAASKNNKQICNCLQTCVSITYMTEISQAYYDAKPYFKEVFKKIFIENSTDEQMYEHLVIF